MDALTPREIETLEWVASGKTDLEIGKIMGLSEHTIDMRMRVIREKLGACTRAQAVAVAFRRKLVE